MGAMGPYYYTVTPVRTDSDGHFEFTNSYVESYGLYYGIVPCTWYYLSVNGYFDPWTGDTNLGYSCDNPAWCQWLCNVTTNSNGYGKEVIILQPSAVVNVTYAALYSDTQFATLYYGLGNQSDFYHTLNFGVLNSGVSTGYSTSQSQSFTASVWGVKSIAIQMMYYASAFYDSIIANPGVVTAGLTRVPNQGFYNNPISEYITNPNGLLSTDPKHCLPFGIEQQSSQTYYYSETNSYTWGASASSPLAIIFGAWGNVVTLDVTVTASCRSDVTIYVGVPQGYGYVNFMAYCPGPAGTSFDPLAKPSVGTGGFELHVFDMSGDG
jgi:hypothetical protein